MIITLKQGTSREKAEELAVSNRAFCVFTGDQYLLVNSSSVKQPDALTENFTDRLFTFNDDLQLASRAFQSTTRSVQTGLFTVGNTNNTVLIAGPCSVESEAQIRKSAMLMKSLGVTTLRAGCYKPRTSPYTFSGLGFEGLKLLAKMRTEFGLQIITEVRDASHVDDVIEYSDIVQIGAKSMYDHGILKKVSKCNKPVLLKRGFGSTLQEFVQCAEFILSGGNFQVLLCERGIRTFENKTRFTLDLCGVSWLKEHCNLPIVLDPSHAMGYAYGVPDLSRACIAMGIEGLMLEVHPDPKNALSDASQQLSHEEFSELVPSLKSISTACQRNLV